MKTKKILSLILSIVFCISLCGCDTFFSNDRYYDDGYYGYDDDYNNNGYNDTVDKLVSHYIDVGQGDCEFIEFPDGETMLIDAGTSDGSSKIIRYIENLGYNYIDYVVATHPHADHIGGMKKVIEKFDIGTVYMPKAETTTSTYSNLLKAIQKKGKKIKTARAGTEIYNGRDQYISVETLAPNSSEYESLNDYSVVLKITYGKVRLLYMGDAEVLSENEILNKNYDVSADVIKVGHHGSNTSSGQNFVNAVNAQFAIFSVGSNNDYHHPHSQVVNRWKNSGAEILRTDTMGSIVLSTDGDSFDINTEKD